MMKDLNNLLYPQLIVLDSEIPCCGRYLSWSTVMMYFLALVNKNNILNLFLHSPVKQRAAQSSISLA